MPGLLHPESGGASIIPTRVFPSGVRASPSMPLLATRPEVLPLISVATAGDKLATIQIARKCKALDLLSGCPIELSHGEDRIRSGNAERFLPSLETRINFTVEASIAGIARVAWPEICRIGR